MIRNGLIAVAVVAVAASAGPAAAQDAAARALLDELGRKVHARDASVIDLFTPNAVLIGSASGERAEGTAQLKHLIGAVYALPARMSWTWTKVSGGASGDLGWLLAEGEFVQEGAERTHRAPYDLTLILERQGAQWRIRQFHGSEPHHPAPATPPAPAR